MDAVIFTWSPSVVIAAGRIVKRKLVFHPKDWPWSSWWYYQKGEKGLIAIDSPAPGQKIAAQGNVKTRTLENHKGAAPAAS